MFTNETVTLASRRKWLKTSTAVVGGAILSLTAVSAPSSDVAPSPTQLPRPKSDESLFSNSEYRLIEELAETIIPADSHSGGAKAAGVADFIDKNLNETPVNERKHLWKEGLRLIDVMSRDRTGRPFVDCTSPDRIAVLTVLSDNDMMDDLPEVRFFRDLKQMTIRGYYTSKLGIHEELEYKGNRPSATFVGCVNQV